MNTPEMTDIPLPVQLLRDDCETRCLLQVKASRRDEIPGGKEIG